MAERILKGGTVVDTENRRLVRCDVALANGRIAAMGQDLGGAPAVDCAGKYILPGLIDAHMHIESTLVGPAELSGPLLRAGTTTCIADPHEFVNVSGAAALRWLLSAVRGLPVDYRVMIPSSVPATPFDTNGAGEFLAADMAEFLAADGVLGLGEMMCFHEVLAGDPKALAKLRLFRGRPIDGHAPGISAAEARRYRAAGVMTDHECSSWEEAQAKLDAGLKVLIREGSGARNLRAIVTGILAHGGSFDDCAFCTDDKHLEDIDALGHIDHCVRLAVQCGMDPVEAIRTATFNPARIYGLADLGAVAPGKAADLLVCDSLETLAPRLVFKRGLPADELLGSVSVCAPPAALLDTVHLGPLSADRLRVPAHAQDLAIGLRPGLLLTEKLSAALPQQDGAFTPDGEFCKLVVAERHGRNGNLSACALRGYGLRRGAVATSISHDSHNLIAAGCSDEDLLTAMRRVEAMHGGFVVVEGGRVLAELPLPVCGLVSDRDAAFVKHGAADILRAARSLGVPEDIDPVIHLSFLALPVIPSIRLLDTGLFDVDAYRLL